MSNLKIWTVEVRVSGASKPVLSLPFRKAGDAEAFALRKREEIQRLGSTHVVEVRQP